ncbi:tetratricopeptide repeat protein [Sphingomonas sediminicola]|uniref:Tetratricopeptide repeat protein n=1 Tax=Sphingomonas sediminicola TaxID=386874 RepID=A0ABX6T762_9SPHN|nr:tetratricopeptide repeat protein [Sphingomonas sediminicola]QNP45239.1 tetratricopeptide repeat protein [Sphingomonas sediminicola]
MAPNFAPAHATLALIQGDNSRAAEPELRRAVELDPSYSEAWLWLGNSLAAQARYQEARDAYWRALELDPLLQPAVLNFFGTSSDLGDAASIERLFRKLKRAGASADLLFSLRAEGAYRLGDYSAALKLLSKHGVDGNGRPKHLLWLSWFESISAIGYYDAMHRVTGCPEWYALMVSGKVLPPKSFEGKPVTPEEFWTSLFFSAPAARSMIELGHSHDLVKLYRAGFRDADEFISQVDRRDMLPELASNVAVALRSEGLDSEADYVLRGRLVSLKRCWRARRSGTRAAGWHWSGRHKGSSLRRSPRSKPRSSEAGCRMAVRSHSISRGNLHLAGFAAILAFRPPAIAFSITSRKNRRSSDR